MSDKLLCFMFGHVYQTTEQVLSVMRLNYGPPPYKLTPERLKIVKTKCKHCGKIK